MSAHASSLGRLSWSPPGPHRAPLGPHRVPTWSVNFVLAPPKRPLSLTLVIVVDSSRVLTLVVVVDVVVVGSSPSPSSSVCVLAGKRQAGGRAGFNPPPPQLHIP